MSARQSKGRMVNGLLLLDKPIGLSSNAALQKVKRLFNARKAGHTGSLDPLATGLLPLCFGEATKFSQSLLDADKTYETTALLGVITDSGDADGNIIERREVVSFSIEQVEAVLAQFRGVQSQIPSMFSALKQQGRPLYELARQGISVPREPRPIVIHELELTAFSSDQLSLRVRCSKGTYIRSLVEDIGLALGCGAHVTALRRTGVSHLRGKDMWALEQLIELAEANGCEALDSLILPVDTLVQSLSPVQLTEAAAISLQRGQTVDELSLGETTIVGEVRLYDHTQQFLGVGTLFADKTLRAKRLLSVI